MQNSALHIFRRDLRLEDNTALNAALKAHDQVHLVFFFDPEQKHHPYFSEPGFQFLVQSLTELEAAVKSHGGTLNFLATKPVEGLKQLCQEFQFKAVYFNKDYTPFAHKRDTEIEALCQELGIECHSFHDALLLPPEKTLKDDGQPYKVFTPFYRNAAQVEVPKPETENLNKISDQKSKNAPSLASISAQIQSHKNPHLAVKGGRQEALSILQALNPHYEEERDFPAKSGTTQLSAHHKFGTISMRESYFQLADFFGPNHTVISELYWHDFFTVIAWYFPEVFGHSFTPKFENLSWENDEKKFKAWCQGQTGFPIVDAGMRELNQTGYMHNRVRMITASFMIKNLHIDWRWGERYFATKLVDYDPAINNGNWQWAASTGCDAQPFFRIFNPWRQQERFDKEATYIKKWVPELQALSPKQIHQWFDEGPNLLSTYPEPIVSHKISSQQSLAKYKQAHAQS